MYCSLYIRTHPPLPTSNIKIKECGSITSKEIVLRRSVYTDVIDCIGHNISFYYITYLFTAVLGLHCCAGQAFLYLQPVGATLWLQRLASQWLLSPRSSGVQASAAAARRLWSSGTAVVVHGLNCREPCAMCHLPGSGIERVSPALAGGFFFTTEPAGKPCLVCSLYSFTLSPSCFSVTACKQLS